MLRRLCSHVGRVINACIPVNVTKCAVRAKALAARCAKYRRHGSLLHLARPAYARPEAIGVCAARAPSSGNTWRHASSIGSREKYAHHRAVERAIINQRLSAS